MPRKKPDLLCRQRGCSERVHLGGYCVQHHQERQEQEDLRREAVHALHWQTIDDALPSSESVRAELLRVSEWWRQVCDSLNSGRNHPILRDEVEYAKEWCIALAEQLVLWERRVRSGHPDSVADFHLKATQERVWESFGNLQKGLRSNGVARATR